MTSSNLAPNKSILFLTNSQYGEAQVILAVSQELLSRGETSIHISSYVDLEPRIHSLQSGQFGATPSSSTITFHPLTGPSMHTTRIQKFGISDIRHKPGFSGARSMHKMMAKLVGTWNGEEWVNGVNEVKRIIADVNPDVVVVDNYFSIGIDAVRELGIEKIILSPCTFMEVGSDQKGLLRSMRKYPAKGAGYKYPLPPSKIPQNILLNISSIYGYITSPAVKEIIKSRKEAGFKLPLPFFKPYLKSVTYILPSTPESDFPCPIPSNFICCGPIFVPGSLDVDVELKTWLLRGTRKTVLINLGTIYENDETNVGELAKGIEVLLSEQAHIQVLWKLKFEGEMITGEVKNILGKYVEEGRVRIEKWLKPELSAILGSGNVICSVHHGGANSYFEAISEGIPQIILPVWYDTYEFAARVEYLGIGIYGSKKSKSAPMANGEELGEALLAVVVDSEESRAMKEKARELARVCNAYGGRARAADTILELCDKKVVDVDKDEKVKVEVANSIGGTTVN